MIDRSRRYTRDEVSEIVREALELNRSEEPFSLSHVDLEDIAKQCGVDADTLEKALHQREIESRKDVIRQRWRAKALFGLLWPTLMCTLFVFMNISSGGFPWAVLPIAFWLLPVLSRYRSRLFPSDALLTKTAQRLASAQSPAH